MSGFWRDRSVFLTGHTGFKGGWLALWLHRLGARVHGYALDPLPSPTVFEAATVGRALASDTRADLADRAGVQSAMAAARPEIVFHLAAQPLVRESYRDPLATLATNVMGTAHVLDAIRFVPSVRAAVVITTDKVYANLDSACSEDDALGGHDPYSASKAAAEIVTASYRSSFFGPTSAAIATARAGNVIGGGDWATDRLVPDCLRAFERGEPVRLRYPHAIRPWQHVLEPLSGYLRLAERLVAEPAQRFARAWNFGPDARDEATVADVAERAARSWGDRARVELDDRQDHPREAETLRLDSTMARRELGWTPRWRLDRAVEMTVGWHRAWLAGEDMAAACARQIDAYERDAA